MGFKVIKPKTRSRLRAPVSFGFLSNGGKVVGTLTISQSVLNKLGWELGDRVEVALGEGKDEGLMLVSVSLQGPYHLSSPGGRKDHTKIQSVRVKIGGLMAEERHDSQPVEFDILERQREAKNPGELLIILPEFAKSAIKSSKKSLI